jgi:DNA invertase Pin-like site-specific DNA recombinase
MKKLTSYEHGERIRKGMLNSLNRIGRKPRLNYDRVFELRENGKSQTEIAKIMKCSKAAISKILRR